MNTTLDQWEVLEAVVQLGSFAAAAEKMNRSQSTISYALSRLQEQFKTPLLELKGRKAQLTGIGKVLLADAEPLLSGFRALERRAFSLGAGGNAEVHLSADSIFPDSRLFAALAGLIRSYPHVFPKLRQGTFLSAVHEFASTEADLCIAALPAREYFVRPILNIRMHAVARADHPLNARSQQLKRQDLIPHLAVIIAGTVGPAPQRQPHRPSQPHLTVHTIEAAIEAVLSGMCFGWLPAYRIAPQVDSGELVRLRIPLGGERLVHLFLAYRDADSTGAEKSYLADLLGVNREVETI